MKIKQIVVSIGLFASILVPSAVFFSSAPVAAEQKCGDVDTSIIGGDICDGVNNSSDNPEDNAIWKLLEWVINIMVAGVGILAVAGIVYGSILYTTAGGSQEQVKKAMGIFTNTAIGVIAFALMYVLLQWLILGGVF